MGKKYDHKGTERTVLWSLWLTPEESDALEALATDRTVDQVAGESILSASGRRRNRRFQAVLKRG